ncbi:acyl-CoA dehydrogenase family protein [Pseudalkalibacillus caeni]|uniref:Acyl-CoA dehydrogenase n=1 Tax=Exobacillus caeni TaxID=2574798 RepID=A0A5R9F1R2_9BACL|nr:acyl-CoA dehydrogenase family protein [Pseudalkalibacillus caeni]TLS37517.1 acyl-CoA dehydrogenase [Pseudalkalibacillus caeni]
MNDLYQSFIKNERQQQLFSLAENLSKKIKERAKEADRNAAFSFENLQDLKESGYVSLTLPNEYGGEGISLYEFLLLQEKLAEGDGSTALAIGWHLGIVMELRDERLWDESVFKNIAGEISKNKKVLNRASTEPATGSPTRGGVPETSAVKDGRSYILNGRKTFTTMAPALDYFIVTAFMEETDSVGSFLIKKEDPGVHIDPTWNTIGMRGTSSDDLLLKDVRVPKERLVELKNAGGKKSAKGWLLHIPACYSGIAIAARNEAVRFAKNYQPNSLDTPIAEVPHIQQKIGEMEIELLKARHLMYSIAERWDQQPHQQEHMGPELAAVKLVVTNAAYRVVDLSMRIAGGRSLSKEYPFERYYRDVRAGLHNPPMDDITIQMLAKRAIENE